MFTTVFDTCTYRGLIVLLTHSVLYLLIVAPSHGQQTTVTINPNAHRFIGGEHKLKRTKYFNHWGTNVISGNTNLGNLATEIWAAGGLNTATGRDTWEFDSFIAQRVPQDPSRPGYFDLDAMRTFLRSGTVPGIGTYRNFLNNNIRYESVREHEDHVFVQSGRAQASWPSWLLDGTNLPVRHNGDAYAEFLNVYLEEVVYGTGPQVGSSQSEAYLPIAPENFYIEIMNEPSWELGPGGLDWDDAIEMHKTVTEKVKSQNPQAQIGGASVGNASFASWNPYRWEYKKQLMDDMVNWRTEDGQKAEFDFWTLHPYDSRRVNSNGVAQHHIPESTGHLGGIMDLFESYSYQLFDDPKRFAVTEYGAIFWSEYAGGSFNNYSRTERQWDMMSDIKKKMLVFMDRPDRIINATPFIGPQWWTGSAPTEDASAQYAFWDRNANGTWTETIVAGLYRMMNDVRGEYIQVETNNDEIQVLGFRDGEQLHLVLNNLSDDSQSISLEALLGGSSIAQATLDRVFWNGSAGVYQDDVDILSNWQNLTLSGQEGAKLTLTLDNTAAYTIATDRRTFYGDDTQTPINLAGARSKVINIAADTEDAVSATVRIAISDRQNVWNETFSIVVNGQAINVPARGANGFDEGDAFLFAREIDVPVSLLNDGNNEVYVDFGSNGGDLVTATLIVNRSLGDFNSSGMFDGDDLDLLFSEFGPTTLGSRYDLVADGIIDLLDVQFWSEQLRGITMPTGDFNENGVVDLADYSVLRDAGGLEFAFDYQYWKHSFGATISAGASQVSVVPEPTSGAVLLLAIGLISSRIRHRQGISVTQCIAGE